MARRGRDPYWFAPEYRRLAEEKPGAVVMVCGPDGTEVERAMSYGRLLGLDMRRPTNSGSTLGTVRNVR